MTEQSYRDQFKQASNQRQQKQKRLLLIALVAFVVLAVVAAAVVFVVYSVIPIGDVKLSPASLLPHVRTDLLGA